MESEYPFTPWPALASSGRQLELPGGTLFFYDRKPDNAENPRSLPALVFIHGLGDEADSWRHVIPLLCANGCRCIAPDLPGFGRSLWRGKITVKRHADAVIKLIEECGVSEAVLIGSSMGCGIAELAAIKRPDLIHSLILVDGCFPVEKRMSAATLIEGITFIGRRWYRKFRQNHEGAWKSLYFYYHDLDAMSEEDKKFLHERVIARVESDNQEHGYFASLRSMSAVFIFAGVLLSKKIKKLDAKIFLLWGENDRVIPAEKTAVFRKLRPDAVFKIIKGGHLPHQENPQECVQAILSVLNSWISHNNV